MLIFQADYGTMKPICKSEKKESVGSINQEKAIMVPKNERGIWNQQLNQWDHITTYASNFIKPA